MSGLFDITGKVALITGGRRGLGRAMALGLAAAGARLALAGSERAEATKLDLLAVPNRVDEAIEHHAQNLG